MYAAIEKVHKGVYGTYDCSDAINFIFSDSMRQTVQKIDFWSWLLKDIQQIYNHISCCEELLRMCQTAGATFL